MATKREDNLEKEKHLIYLDNNATTQVDERVLAEMLPYFTQYYGNPASRYYTLAETAKKAVETSRVQCAKLIGAKSQEIFFTSGATESNNIAIKGFCFANAYKGKHILTSLIEHRSVLYPLRELEKLGFRVSYVKPDHYGRVTAEAIEGSFTADTILVSVMYANNELGTLNPIDKIAEICYKKNIIFHCDATQGVGKIPIDVNKTAIDMLSFSGHKIYGPKGIGGLFIRRRMPKIKVQPLVNGGEQEDGLRSGTLNVPGIMGLGAACAVAEKVITKESKHLFSLSERMIKNLSVINGVSYNNHPTERLPGTLNFTIDSVNAESLLSRIADKVAISSGSACSSTKIELSHVLQGIGLSNSMAKSTVRVSIGRFNTEDEIDYASEMLIHEIKHLRSIL
jgi:cysteine desulfurase